ncbi:hypothetical protein V6N13_123791 [Hibiscus sabdariffa]|uniref:WRKY domain-containing protein n=1 Tax=Hibiscus sabdariffa TaxID=183260 RepID=A0ABR2QUH1_9ROSI
MQNQGLFEEQDMGFFTTFPQSLTPCHPLMASHQSLKAFNTAADALPHSAANLSETLLSSLTSHKHTQHLLSDSGRPQLLSLHRSSSNFRALGEVKECLESKKMSAEDHLRVSAMKMKRIKGRRKVREPRFCFKTKSDVDVLDDGYKWRKYGQKVVKNTQHPRSYYRCTQDNCRVKKRVERLAEDPRMVITTYEGRHVHSPSHDLDDSQPPHSQLNDFFR